MRRKTTEDFIQQAIKIHGDKFSYEKTNYKNCRTKVIVTTSDGNDIEVWPLDFIKKYKAKNEKYSTENFIKRAKKIFGDEYDYSKSVCKSSSDIVTIICKKHGEFYKKASSHISLKQGCPYCGKNMIKDTEDFIQKANEVHKGKYTYEKTNYCGPNSKVIVTCKKHGDFYVIPSEHLDGAKCKKCVVEESRTPKEEFLKYLPDDIILNGSYNGLSNKANFKCKKCGYEWETKPSKIKNGHGCPRCSGSVVLTEDFIKKSKEIHGDTYDYSKSIYVSHDTPITITCPIHGDFSQPPISHYYTINCCPSCNKKSFLEAKVSKLLSENNIFFETNKSFKEIGNKSYDFFIPSKNTFIECQGVQHFKPINLFGGEKQFLIQEEHDKIKHDFSVKNGYKLLYFTNIKDFGDRFLGEELIFDEEKLIEKINSSF